MESFFYDKTLKYDGSQLASHFAYKNFGVLGDSIVAFIGECDVKTASLVDLEDAQSGKFIYSKNMLHFIVEHFTGDLNWAIACQRLLSSLLIDDIRTDQPELNLIRRGNDIYEDDFKLNVSIATASPISCLIHTGVNINADGAPVLAKGLEDYKLSPQAIARGVMNRYVDEIRGMQKARAKVRGVS